MVRGLLGRSVGALRTPRLSPRTLAFLESAKRRTTSRTSDATMRAAHFPKACFLRKVLNAANTQCCAMERKLPRSLALDIKLSC